MTEFYLPLETLEIIHQFHGVEIVFYTEGKEDLRYWDYLLKYLEVENFYIDNTTGKSHLKKINNYIKSKKTKVITLNDSNYSELVKNQIKHNQIVYTYGYSIENSMYCPKTISKIIKKYALSHKSYLEIATGWFGDFCRDCKQLLIYDLANEKYHKNKKVMGDNCSRFLTSAHSCNLSNSKILEHINTIKSYFDKKEIKDCENLINKDKRDLKFIIRGKFYSNAIINFIKNIVKREGYEPGVISKITFFVLSIGDGCTKCDENLKCECFSSTKQSILKAIKSI